MHLIDFHSHIYPEEIAEKAAKSICGFYGLRGGGMNGTPAQLLQRGKIAGIDRFVILPVGLKPCHVRHINQFVLDQTAAQPSFLGFGTVHAAMEHLTDEVEFIINSGLHGIKMHPDTQGFSLDDARLFPVYDMLQDRIPVIFHMGDQHRDFSHPARLCRVLKLFPRLRVIAAHFGGYTMYRTAYEYLWNQDCYMDISSSLMFMPEGVGEDYIRRYGAGRLVYGSDYPLWDPVTEVNRFLQLKLTDQEREQIAFRTAQEILGPCASF